MTDDSMSDDVFEAEEASMPSGRASLNVLSETTHKTPSPTGYKDYKPPPELLEPAAFNLDQVNHKTILLGDSGVGKTSLLVQFDTGQFQGGSFAATVGIGFTIKQKLSGKRVTKYYIKFGIGESLKFWCARPEPDAFNVAKLSEMSVPNTPNLIRRTLSRKEWKRRSNSNGVEYRAGVSNGSNGPQQRETGSGGVDPLIAKVMLLGDSGVGKTCLLVRFRDGHFLSGNFISTVGIDFRNKTVTVDDTKVKLQIWDTAGQERFRSVTHAYYRDAHALLLLYDVTNKASFDNIRAWLGEIREYAQEDVVIMLLGNKADCGPERTVRKEEGERLAREYNVAFMETSAKSGMNVELAFTAIARELKSRQSKDPDDSAFNVREYIREQSQRTTCPPCST